MSRVYWDSMLFIYWMEDHPAYAPRVDFIFQSMLVRGDTLCASYLSLGEVLAGSVRQNRVQSIKEVERFFDSGLVEVLPFNRSAALQFARLRATVKVNPADAIHLGCAAASGVDLFLTHDGSLQKLRVQGIEFIAGLDVNVF